MKRTAGKPPKLLRWQVSYIRRAARLRKQLTNAALGARFGISVTTVQGYICDRQLHGCREDYNASVVARRQRRAAARGAA